ncbi:hypothetical protein VNI00_014599 [Paramarasmius palmivorus]|uniref:Uncharacterized protein n=1 Tax=Paramarasmius palmivorus TaxID=297713 RepID=A0AAW0BVI4_9AGAR
MDALPSNLVLSWLLIPSLNFRAYRSHTPTTLDLPDMPYTEALYLAVTAWNFLLYGAYIVLFGICVYILRKRQREAYKYNLLANIILFLLTSVYLALGMVHDILAVCESCSRLSDDELNVAPTFRIFNLALAMASRLYAPFTLSPPVRAVPALIAAVVVLGWGWGLVRLTSDSTLGEYDKNLSYHTQEERDSVVEDPLIQIKEVDSDVSKDDSDIGDLEDTCMGIESDHDQSEETDSEALIQESDPKSLVPDLHSKFEKVTFGLGLLAVSPPDKEYEVLPDTPLRDTILAAALLKGDTISNSDTTSLDDMDIYVVACPRSSRSGPRLEDSRPHGSKFDTSTVTCFNNGDTNDINATKPDSNNLPPAFRPESSLPSPESTPIKKMSRAKPKERKVCKYIPEHLTKMSLARRYYIDLQTFYNKVAYEDEFKAWYDNREVDAELKEKFALRAAELRRDRDNSNARSRRAARKSEPAGSP